MQQAVEQHRQFAERLREAGVDVLVIESHDPEAPDAVFPNNWFTTHDEAEVGGAPSLLRACFTPSHFLPRRL